MPLAKGSRLGRYEIMDSLGAGGMGEVYKARDTRLDRDVAIKILPQSVAGDSERLARFDREAKAVAALSHPNILALHDAGTEEGVAFAVMELLDGETLRDRLKQGPLPVRRAVDVTIQIARGLAAAHAKALVHRDLKPENVFLVSDGQIKILDFGLARQADTGGSGATQTVAAMTDPGTVMGTVGYMAPEQVRGQTVDARTDLFTLGALLFEMLTGDRAFRRETPAETMTAILREEVPDLPPGTITQAPAIDRIIRHCLEKNPAERFQSARDVAFALEALSGTSVGMAPAGSGATQIQAGASSATKKRGLVLLTAALALVVLTGVASWLTGYIRVGSAAAAGTGAAAISYKALTFDEGFVFAARFASDGKTVVYSADWEHQTRDLFVTSTDNPGVRALGHKNGDLLALAGDGSLAILVDAKPSGSLYQRRGTIARGSLNGGTAVRRELGQVMFADFAPDGLLAVVRSSGKAGVRPTLEWPQGRPLFGAGATGEGASATSAIGILPAPRISPSGDHIAFFGCGVGECSVYIGSRDGKVVAKSPGYFDWWGLAWAPGGQEVWFSVVDTEGVQCAVYAMDLHGRVRPLYRAPGALTLHDVSADGRILASFDQVRFPIEARAVGANASGDLSWKEGGSVDDVADNGAVLFTASGDSAGPRGSVYIRRPGESEPIRIADGGGRSLSRDGKTAVVVDIKPLRLLLVPAEGLPQPMDIGSLDTVGVVESLPDGRLIIELSRTPGEKPAVFIRPKDGGPVAPLLPANMHLVGARLVSPDSQRIAVVDEAGEHFMCTVPATGQGSCSPLASVTVDETVAGWTSDSRALYVYSKYPIPARVDRVDVTTGRRELHAMLQPLTVASAGISTLVVDPSGSMTYQYARNRSVLYVISGVR